MTDAILKRLYVITQEYEKLRKQSEEEAVIAQPALLKTINIRLSAITDLVEAYYEYKKIETQLNDAKQLSNAADNELASLAKDEIKFLHEALLRNENTIKELLLPKNAEDVGNAIIEIRGATGGDEANIFAGDLFEMYRRYSDNKNWHIEITDSSICEAGGFSQICFVVKGKNVFKTLKYESGIHRVQRVPATEAKGRVHTSTASVAVLPEANEIIIKINPQDLRIDTYRSSGAGGQHVNMTDSAVRVTHIPTGIVTTSQEGRSQHINKEQALSVLRARLYEKKLEEENDKIHHLRTLAVGSGKRSEKIRTYNYPQNRVTDHRIGLTLNNLDRIMAGDLDLIITSLMAYDQKEMMENAIA